MSTIKARKRLGQHFLMDKRIARRIVRAIDPQPGDSVIEIGPGKGALTSILLEIGCRVTAVEFDRDMTAHLRAGFGNNSKLRIIENDFLKVSFAEMPEKIKLIGNIPYNITTSILEKLFDYREILIAAVLTVQSEVADRLAAPPGNRAYGSFTVIMKAGFEIKKMFNINPRAFKPIPEIDSTVIKLASIDRMPEDFENFKAFIRGCFKQKRKTLANSMQLGLNLPKQDCEGMIKKIGKSENIRAEQLAFEDYSVLYNIWRGRKV
jgi:16S rRNA (adenine1518-N6/adenine1519-N6)-dimethyltransferase